jgi:hypothetical protein
MQQSSRFTPVRRTPARGSKRKRTMLEESESMDEYDTKASCKGDIEFVEVCPQGKFVKLRNKGDKVCRLQVLCKLKNNLKINLMKLTSKIVLQNVTNSYFVLYCRKPL